MDEYRCGILSCPGGVCMGGASWVGISRVIEQAFDIDDPRGMGGWQVGMATKMPKIESGTHRKSTTLSPYGQGKGH